MIEQQVDEKVKKITEDLQAKMKQSVTSMIKPGLLGARRDTQSEVKQRSSTARQTGEEGEDGVSSISNTRPSTGIKKIVPSKPTAAKRSESKESVGKTAGSKDTIEQKKKDNERRLEEARIKREEMEKKKKDDAEKKRLMEEERAKKNEEAAAIKKKAAAEAREKSTQPLAPNVN